MKKFNIGIVALTMMATSHLAHGLSGHLDEVSNYMICKVNIEKDSEVLSSHLVTTYQPYAAVLQTTEEVYHSPVTIVSNCIAKSFDEDFNEQNLYRDGKEYIDLCFKLSNGVYEDRDGYAEFYLRKRSVKKFYEFKYLNQFSPLKVEGSQTKSRTISGYKVVANCKNEMLSGIDSIWAAIRQHRLGNN